MTHICLRGDAMGRVLIDQEPFVDLSAYQNGQPLGWHWAELGRWPASWVDHPQRPQGTPSVAAFRLPFIVTEAGVARLHVSADNRYRLFLDGEPVGRGPERGDPGHWRYESYDLALNAGAHTLVAQSWWLGNLAPFAQMTVRPGFLLAAEGRWQEILSTGKAPWEAMLLPGIEHIPATVTWGAGGKVRLLGDRYAWGWESGEIGHWAPVETICPACSAYRANNYLPTWLLQSATLPPMYEQRLRVGAIRYLTADAAPYPVTDEKDLPCERSAWQACISAGQPVTVPAHARRRIILDLENYYCGYPEMTVSGGRGASVSELWAESLFVHADPRLPQKGNRDEIAGKYFHGEGNVYLPDGGAHRVFSSLWWCAGRYIEWTIETGDEPLLIEQFILTETHYPLVMEGDFHCADARIEAILPIAKRSLQMCAHETYMDCPYYEQLMYVGDTRLEVLTTYLLTRDARLPRKAIQCFNDSRLPSGLTTSRFPSRETQIIPPFSLWWVGMVYDHWRWRDADFARRQLPAVRGVLETFRAMRGEDGLLVAPRGWNFMDWVKKPEWPAGTPFDADLRLSSILNLQCALILTQTAEMEEGYGEKGLAERDREAARALMAAVLNSFWNDARGLIADEQGQQYYSEHAQCLALLSGLLPAANASRVAEGLLQAPDLARTTIYFSHYLFETLYQLGNAAHFFDSLSLWFALQTQGFKTTFEEPGDTRSDCHGWGAHPIYHCYATLLGIRPAAPGFSRVRIAPLLGNLSWASGTLPHPSGDLTVNFRQAQGHLQADISLPDGLHGDFCWAGETYSLKPGTQRLSL
jgi:hypothetical protein